MSEIVRSRLGMCIISFAALLVCLGYVLLGLGYAVLSLSASPTSNHLIIAGCWFEFAGGCAAALTLFAVAWALYRRRQWSECVVLTAAAASTSVMTVGFLVVAQAAPNTSAAGNIVVAVGLGGWFLLTVAQAGIRPTGDGSETTSVSRMALWLLSGAGVLAIAVGLGLPTAALGQATLAITSGVITAVGFAVLAITVTIGKVKGLLATRQFPVLVGGLWILAIAFVAQAVAGEVALGPPPYSLGSIRIGASLPLFITAAGLLVLALAGVGQAMNLSTRNKTAPAVQAA